MQWFRITVDYRMEGKGRLHSAQYEDSTDTIIIFH
jgi:hypothetical protein